MKLVDAMRIVKKTMPDTVKALSEKGVTAPENLKLSQTAGYIDKVNS